MLAAIDNLIFILLVAIAALFRLLTKAAESKRESTPEDESTFPEPDPPQQQQPRTRPQSDDEQIRKFLEALGQPRTANVPPPVTPRADVPPRPIAPVQPPRTFVDVLKTPIPQPMRSRRVEPAKSSEPPSLPQRAEPVRRRSKVEAPTVAVHEITAAPFPETERLAASTQTKATPETGTTDLVRLLRTPGGLRQAIILREIFGTPRSLQSAEELPGTA